MGSGAAGAAHARLGRGRRGDVSLPRRPPGVPRGSCLDPCRRGVRGRPEAAVPRSPSRPGCAGIKRKEAGGARHADPDLLPRVPAMQPGKRHGIPSINAPGPWSSCSGPGGSRIAGGTQFPSRPRSRGPVGRRSVGFSVTGGRRWRPGRSGSHREIGLRTEGSRRRARWARERGRLEPAGGPLGRPCRLALALRLQPRRRWLLRLWSSPSQARARCGLHWAPCRERSGRCSQRRWVG